MHFSLSLCAVVSLAALSVARDMHNPASAHAHRQKRSRRARSVATPVPTHDKRDTTTSNVNDWWTSPTTEKITKSVVAHFIVGNAYSYTPDQWATEIQMAFEQGIDAFALNIGSDDWEPARVQDAYDAALASGTGFKMFFSFDMTALPCNNPGAISDDINMYANHGAQYKDANGASIVSTFGGGSSCMGDPDWENAVKSGLASGVTTRFIPAFFDDIDNVSMKSLYPVMNGDFLWGGGWPKGDLVIDWSEDNYRLTHDGLDSGDLYMTSSSPWFFVHYAGRNSIWRGDDHLFARRWQQLIENRDLVDIVEVISWNDYGESHYIGPIGKDQPDSQAWVDGFDHTGWLAMLGYFTTAFKTGVYPTIIQDKIFLWGRPHGKNDVASNDSLGKPDNWDWTTDYVWVVLFSTGAGSLTLSQGSSFSSSDVTAGINLLSLPQDEGSTVTAILTRDNVQVFSFTAPITFTHSPVTYNFNANVAAGP